MTIRGEQSAEVKRPHNTSAEPDITINGRPLLDGHVMSIRCALNQYEQMLIDSPPASAKAADGLAREIAFVREVLQLMIRRDDGAGGVQCRDVREMPARRTIRESRRVRRCKMIDQSDLVCCDKTKRSAPCSGAVAKVTCPACGRVYRRCEAHGGERGAKRSCGAHRSLEHGPAVRP